MVTSDDAAGPLCPACETPMAGPRTASRPEGYALVYKCPACGKTHTDTSEGVESDGDGSPGVIDW